jgi:hypothetical protein
MHSALIDHATELLLSMYSEDLNLFSSSTIQTGSRYQNEYLAPDCFRYSTVSLLGLQQSFNFLGRPERFVPLLDGFANRHWRQINSVGDLGMLCSLLQSIAHPLQKSVFAAIKERWAFRDLPSQLTAQEICQLLIALCEMHARESSVACETLAREVWACIEAHFFCGATGFCFHNLKWYRPPFVSFGAITYYLRALHDFGKAFQVEEASRRYREVLKRVVALQGPRGEWPWFFNALKGNVAEWYEIYSVHQHAMAFLFLFPALAEGDDDLPERIRRSYRWIFGNNELGAPMIQLNPFFIYRSIRRREGRPRLRRFARAAACSWLGRRPSFAPISSVEINKECRSYEIGWLLYVWSQQRKFEEFHSLTGTSLANASAAQPGSSNQAKAGTVPR